MIIKWFSQNVKKRSPFPVYWYIFARNFKSLTNSTFWCHPHFRYLYLSHIDINFNNTWGCKWIHNPTFFPEEKHDISRSLSLPCLCRPLAWLSLTRLGLHPVELCSYRNSKPVVWLQKKTKSESTKNVNTC